MKGSRLYSEPMLSFSSFSLRDNILVASSITESTSIPITYPTTAPITEPTSHGGLSGGGNIGWGEEDD